jgi:hypothetical protein
MERVYHACESQLLINNILRQDIRTISVLFQSASGVFQQFKVSPVWFISPNKKDKSVSVFMEKTTKDVPQGAIEVVPADGDGGDFPVIAGGPGVLPPYALILE